MGHFALLITEVNEAAALYRSGLSMRQIATRYHVSQSAVRNALILQNVPRRPRIEARRLRTPGARREVAT